MLTVKIVPRKKGNKDGSFPITISSTKDWKSYFIYLDQNLIEFDRDEIGHRLKKIIPEFN